MKTYTVKDISNMVHANPETVRRWIRTGKLKASKSSRKDGNVVQEKDLFDFLSRTPKYTVAATALAAANPLLGIATPFIFSFITLASEGITDALNERSQKKISESAQSLARILGNSSDDSIENIKKYLEDAIAESQKKIDKKNTMIASLQAEIKQEKKSIESFKFALSHLTELLNYVYSSSEDEEAPK